MMTRLIVVERQLPGVIHLQFNDPFSKNGFSEACIQELQTALSLAAEDREAKVLVLSGLPDVFCSGDTKELLVQMSTGEEWSPTGAGQLLFAKSLLDIPYPTIAAMEGHAIGGGFALALCADIVLMARESRYAVNFMGMGFTPNMGSTRLLEQALSPAIARELLLMGEFRRGDAFADCSGINYILPRHEVLPKAMDLAMHIAEKPRPALEILKRELSRKRRIAFEDDTTAEIMMNMILLAQGDLKQMIEQSYIE